MNRKDICKNIIQSIYEYITNPDKLEIFQLLCFLISPNIAPPIISAAPATCTGAITSCNKIAENKSAETGSI